MKTLLCILLLIFTVITVGCGELPTSPNETQSVSGITLDSHWVETWFEYTPAHPVPDEITFIKNSTDPYNTIFLSTKYVVPFEVFRGNYTVISQTMTFNKMDSYVKIRFDDVLGGSWEFEMRTANWTANLVTVTIGKIGYAETKIFRRAHEI